MEIRHNYKTYTLSSATFTTPDAAEALEGQQNADVWCEFQPGQLAILNVVVTGEGESWTIERIGWIHPPRKIYPAVNFADFLTPTETPDAGPGPKPNM